MNQNFKEHFFSKIKEHISQENIPEFIRNNGLSFFYNNKIKEINPAEHLKNNIYLHTSKKHSGTVFAEAKLISRKLQGVNHAFLKGFVLQQYYGEETYRPSKDIDILIQFDDLKKTVEILRNLGYRFESGKSFEEVISSHQNNPLHYRCHHIEEMVRTVEFGGFQYEIYIEIHLVLSAMWYGLDEDLTKYSLDNKATKAIDNCSFATISPEEHFCYLCYSFCADFLFDIYLRWTETEEKLDVPINFKNLLDLIILENSESFSLNKILSVASKYHFFRETTFCLWLLKQEFNVALKNDDGNIIAEKSIDGWDHYSYFLEGLMNTSSADDFVFGSTFDYYKRAVNYSYDNKFNMIKNGTVDMDYSNGTGYVIFGKSSKIDCSYRSRVEISHDKKFLTFKITATDLKFLEQYEARKDITEIFQITVYNSDLEKNDTTFTIFSLSFPKDENDKYSPFLKKYYIRDFIWVRLEIQESSCYCSFETTENGYIAQVKIKLSDMGIKKSIKWIGLDFIAQFNITEEVTMISASKKRNALYDPMCFLKYEL